MCVWNLVCTCITIDGTLFFPLICLGSGVKTKEQSGTWWCRGGNGTTLPEFHSWAFLINMLMFFKHIHFTYWPHKMTYFILNIFIIYLTMLILTFLLYILFKLCNTKSVAFGRLMWYSSVFLKVMLLLCVWAEDM